MASYFKNDQKVVKRIKTKIEFSSDVSSSEESNDEHEANIPKPVVITPATLHQTNITTADLYTKVVKRKNESTEEDAMATRLQKRVNESRFKESKTRSLTYPFAPKIKDKPSDQNLIRPLTTAPHEYNKVVKKINVRKQKTFWLYLQY